MNKIVQNYIPAAMAQLEKYERLRNIKDLKIEKEMKGYISSLSASIIISGLEPTLAFYSSKENSAKANRAIVLEWISGVLNEEESYKSKSIINLFKHALEPSTDKRKLEEDILNAIVALKLCIRTFELK